VIEQGRANYIGMWDEIYYRPLSKTSQILDIQACFQVAHGSYKRREAMLWQKISPANDYAALVRLLTTALGVPKLFGGVDQPFGEMTRKRRSHQDPVVGSDVAQRDQHDSGLPKDRLHGSAGPKDLRVQVD
jgi:hypothetical protein